MTNKRAGELALLARSWNNPPDLQIPRKGFRFEKYDKTQRAYVILREEGKEPSALDFVLSGSEEKPVVNQRHESVSLEPLARQLVLLMDGSRDRSALLRCLRDEVANGSLQMSSDGGSLTSAKKSGGSLKKAMDRALVNLARSAMLVQ